MDTKLDGIDAKARIRERRHENTSGKGRRQREGRQDDVHPRGRIAMRKGTCVLVLLAALLGVSAASVTSASAQAKVFKWKLQTVDDASLMEYKLLAVKFADRVRELSNGRLDIKVFPAGGLSPSYEVFDAVKKGLIDMSQHYLVYWAGKDPGLYACCEWAAMRDPLQGMVWYYHAGGLDIMRKILAKHGLHYLGASPIGGEHIWSKKPIRGVADLKGMKVRAAGAAGDMFSILGASVVSVPGGEVYQALERGVVDAAEFTFPTVNYALGFHEVTKYIILPTYSGGGTYDWFVNAKAWEALPDDLKKIVEVALNETTLLYWLKNIAETEVVMEKLRKHGMTFIQWPPEEMAKLEAARVAAMEKFAAKSPEFATKLKSQMELLRLLGYGR